jgi:hypothetical protein
MVKVCSDRTWITLDNYFFVPLNGICGFLRRQLRFCQVNMAPTAAPKARPPTPSPIQPPAAAALVMALQVAL